MLSSTIEEDLPFSLPKRNLELRLAAPLLPESDGLLLGLPKAPSHPSVVDYQLAGWHRLPLPRLPPVAGKGGSGGVKWTSYVLKICRHFGQIRKLLSVRVAGFLS